MKRNVRLLIAVLLVLFLIQIACRNSTLSSNNTEITANGDQPTASENTIDTADAEVSFLDLEPNPASIDIILEENSSSTASIGPEGGILETVDPKGTVYRLIVPEGALIFPEKLSMTPIAEAHGDAIEEYFLAGVSLQPEGLHFLELVTLEIQGAVVEEGAVGFGADGGGQDLHLTLSSQSNDTISITTSHFSDLGAARERFEEAVAAFIPLATIARARVILVVGSEAQKVAMFRDWLQQLLNFGSSVGTYQEWKEWSSAILAVILRLKETSRTESWDDAIPGYTNLIAVMNQLMDTWLDISDQVYEDLAASCLDGAIEDLFKMVTITEIVERFVLELNANLSQDNLQKLPDWLILANNCSTLGLAYQAKVVTTGANFFSDISLGSEDMMPGLHTPNSIDEDAGDEFDFAQTRVRKSTSLDVDYVDGFFAPCSGTSGVIQIGYTMDWVTSNLNPLADTVLESIEVDVKIITHVFLDCFNMTVGTYNNADASKPFHGEALEKLNREREGEEQRWIFELKYDPGGGLVSQFEEGPKELLFDGGKYDVWQLISLYVVEPGN